MILLDFKWHLIDAFIPTTPNTTAGLDNSRIWWCWAFLQLKNRKLLTKHVKYVCSVKVLYLLRSKVPTFQIQFVKLLTEMRREKGN